MLYGIVKFNFGFKRDNCESGVGYDAIELSFGRRIVQHIVEYFRGVFN